jgi:hypothetical protein
VDEGAANEERRGGAAERRVSAREMRRVGGKCEDVGEEKEELHDSVSVLLTTGNSQPDCDVASFQREVGA